MSNAEVPFHCYSLFKGEADKIRRSTKVASSTWIRLLFEVRGGVKKKQNENKKRRTGQTYLEGQKRIHRNMAFN